MREISLLLLTLAAVPPLPAPNDSPPQFLDALAVRHVGPAQISGRITAVAVVESHPQQMYVASASGGLWKTLNDGASWTPVFDNENVAAIGDVAVAPSNPQLVWVGTGEANPRNSVSEGDGIYQSGDGGKSWRHRGLPQTAHISRVVIHPRQLDIVYVAALGHLWAPNKERGIYKTTDGGRTWRLVAYLDQNTGFIDLVMDPHDPETLFAAAYECRRDAFSGANPKIQLGVNSGIYKTTDGGASWYKVRLGLQGRKLGRCGLAVYRKDPRILYAIVQTELTDIRNMRGQDAATSDRKETGGVFRSVDGGDSWTKVNDLCPRPFYFGQIRIDPNDAQRVYVLGISLHSSTDGGKTFRHDDKTRVHVDHHALWLDPHDSRHIVLGGDGGLYFSHDQGATWEHQRDLPVSQFYAACVDQRRPYNIYGGLQDHGTWGGPSRLRDGVASAARGWFPVLGMDGFHCQADPTDLDTVYAEGQYGNLHRVNVRTGVSKAIRPGPAKGQAAYRFNWSAPLVVSVHDPRLLWFGGNHVFRSGDRGETWNAISPDLTHGKPGPSADMGHTITAVAESPLKAGLLYAGTDDGRLQVTSDAGAHWNELSSKLRDLPIGGSVSCVECSRHAEGTAYVTLDRHRLDDRRPYIYKTIDRGSSWSAMNGDLPHEGYAHVIREDLWNRNLLFVGTSRGLFVSVTGGQRWHRIRSGLPTVAVSDLVIHPRDRELVVATHGRGIYILDIAPLEEVTTEFLSP
jgi:photosystem II stability/assembly factor-like uncharacterized protein